MTNPVEPPPETQQYQDPTIGHNPTGRNTNWNQLSKKQRTMGIVGLVAIVLLVLCLCCGLLGWLVADDDDRDSVEIKPEPSSSTTLNATEPGKPLTQAQVVGIFTGDTIEVAIGTSRRTVHVTEVVAPAQSAGQCWGEQSRQFAEQTLSGKLVKLFTPTGGEPLDGTDTLQAQVVLPEGTNYAVAALEAGALKLTDNGAGSPLRTAFRAAQNKADKGNVGLWGAPCDGGFALPAAPPTPQPTPAPANPQPAPAPKPEPAPEPRSTSGGNAYYKNCDAVRAAGAAPLHAGEPGYRSALDRDKDGIACE